MKIHIMGASGAGSTTLGIALSEHTGYPYFDTDTYFFEPSDIPYTVKRDPYLRSVMLKQDLVQHPNWIVGGSLVSWGNEWPAMFDLVVFLYIPPEIRMQRLLNRERERYGDAITTDTQRKLLFDEFIKWAKGYDDNNNTTKGRTFKIHQEWLKQLTCPVLEITGDTTVNERISIILSRINQNHTFISN